MREHAHCASAENDTTPFTKIAESDCADGQMKQSKEQFVCTDVVHKLHLLAVCYELFGHLYADFLVQGL
jgi:hypothetical protein